MLVPVGDGNIISGVWKGFKDLLELGLIEEMPRIISVQSDKSDAVNRTIAKLKESGKSVDEVEIETVSASTRADSIAVDEPRDGVAAVRAVMETWGDGVTVSDDEIIQNISDLAASSGIFAEPAGVTSVAGLRKMAREGTSSELPGPVVCLLTGNGLKDVEAVLEE